MRLYYFVGRICNTPITLNFRREFMCACGETGNSHPCNPFRSQRLSDNIWTNTIQMHHGTSPISAADDAC